MSRPTFISATVTHIQICLTNKISSPFEKFLESKVHLAQSNVALKGIKVILHIKVI